MGITGQTASSLYSKKSRTGCAAPLQSLLGRFGSEEKENFGTGSPRPEIIYFNSDPLHTHLIRRKLGTTFSSARR